MPSDVSVIPLPCTPSVWPVERAYEVEPTCKYTFTIDSTHLIPSPTKLVDIRGDECSRGILKILVLILTQVSRMFHGKRPFDWNNAEVPGTRRIDVFMEYLLPEGAVVGDETDEVRLIELVGIRFHIMVHDRDSEMNLDTSIARFIHANGGEDLGQCDEDEGDKKKKKDGKKKKKEQRKKPPTKLMQLFDEVLTIDNIFTYYWLVNAYVREPVSESDYLRGTINGTMYPGFTHPLCGANAFSWDNSLVDGMHPRQATEYVDGTFPFPSIVFRMPVDLLRHPYALPFLTLPGAPTWYDPVRDVRTLRNVMGTLRSEATLKEIFSRAEALKRDDLYEIRKVQDAQYARIKDAGTDVIARWRRTSVKYIDATLQEGSNVSDAWAAMNEHARELETWTDTNGVDINDYSLGYTANWLTSLMCKLEAGPRISTLHVLFIRVLLNALHALDPVLDLHNNMIVFGGHEKGKSFVLDLVMDYLVPGTVERLSNLTAKALATNDNVRDMVYMRDELPAEWKSDNIAGGDTGDSMLKESLTSCITTTQMPFITEDGDRVLRKYSAERVAVNIMASNEHKGHVPEPLLSRVQALVLNDFDRPGYDVENIMQSMTGIRHIAGDEVSREISQNLEDEIRTMQTMSNMIWKAIYERNLVGPDVSVMQKVLISVKENLSKKGIMGNAMPYRAVKSLWNQAKVLTIAMACHKYANDKRSKGYNKKPDSYKTILDIQPLLFCCEQKAIFLTSLNADLIIDTEHFLFIEIALCAAMPFYENGSDGEPDHKDGFVHTKPLSFLNFSALYDAMETAQMNKSYRFQAKISRENMKGALKSMKTVSFKGQSIIMFNQHKGIVSINHSFVKAWYEFDCYLGRYKCTLDPHQAVKEAILEAYINKYSTKRKYVLGYARKDTPFVLETMQVPDDVDSVLTSTIPLSNTKYTPDIIEDEVTEHYRREGDTVVWETDFEEFKYQSFLKECGITATNMTAQSELYDYEVSASKYSARDAEAEYPQWILPKKNSKKRKRNEEN